MIETQMTATINHEHREHLDWTLVWALGGLMVLGTAFIYSACLAAEADAGHHWYQQNFIKQLIWYSIGIVAMVGASLIDYHTLARWSVVAYLSCIILLVAVLIPGIGTSHYGARRWIDLGPFQMQPSEFAKLAFILGLANYISRPAEEMKRTRIFFSAIGLMALPFLLIMKEPDLGSALVLIPVGLVMLFIGGAPLKYMLIIGGSVGLLITLMLVDILYAPPNWQMFKLEDYQKRRILVYFGRNFSDAAPRNATAADLQKLVVQQRNDSYNVKQALISVGSGGLMGKGWRQGTQNALGYLPRAVAHNDFIFSVIAEESGFVGSVVVITLYAVVLFTGIRIAGQARDRLGKLMAVGVVTLLFSHVFINIGMNIRLMPVTGVPLPLLSYGGSSVLCSLIAAGLLQNVHIHRRDY
jgi:rod shape determining protein RodA